MGSLSRLLGVPRPGFSSYLLHSVDKIYSHDFMGFIRFDGTSLPVSKLFRCKLEVEFFLTAKASQTLQTCTCWYPFRRLGIRGMRTYQRYIEFNS